MLQFGGFPIALRLFPKKQEVPLGNLRIHGIHAPPRSLSQLVTTFIGIRARLQAVGAHLLCDGVPFA